MAASYDDFYSYGCGLTLLALAGLIYLIARQNTSRRSAPWLVGFAIAQGLTEWSPLVVDPASRSAVIGVGVLDVLSLVALAEFGRGVSIAASPIDGRWIYAPLAALLIATVAGKAEWFTVVIAVLIAVQGALLIAKVWIQSLAEAIRPRLQSVSVVAALAFLLGSVFDSGISKLLSLLMVVITLWMIAAHRRQPATHSTRSRQYGFPFAFCVLLLVGALFFAGDQQQPNHLFAAQPEQFALVSDAERLGGAVGSVWLQACCLALAPPLVLIAVTWVVSRVRRDATRVGI